MDVDPAASDAVDYPQMFRRMSVRSTEAALAAIDPTPRRSSRRTRVSPTSKFQLVMCNFRQSHSVRCAGAPDSFTEFFRARQKWRNRLLSL